MFCFHYKGFFANRNRRSDKFQRRGGKSVLFRHSLKSVEIGGVLIQPNSIGIIGGADGPTAVFVTGSPLLPVLLGAGLILAVIALAMLFLKRK